MHSAMLAPERHKSYLAGERRGGPRVNETGAGPDADLNAVTEL